MPETAWLALSFFASLLGTGWFALALDAHWQQVRESTSSPTASTRRLLRVLGTAALGVSFTACFLADHPSMAPLVWIMGIAIAAFSIALILTWRPRVLRALLLSMSA